ncbi:MAG: hypothetical protein FJ189_09420 [Gammaproteobacteria bacterium]|nr:hypothetical protein [Gammaproteobacteria bacterium]
MKKIHVPGLLVLFGLTAALDADAHELRLVGKGKGPNGEEYRIAFGHWSEPAREDEMNGIDLFVWYEDGRENGDVVDVGRGDKLRVTKLEAMFYEPKPASNPWGYEPGKMLNITTLCDPAQGITLACPRQKLDALASFFDPGNPQPEVYRNRYTNNIRPTDSGIYGYKIGFCVQDLYGQTGADGQTLKTPWKRQSPKPESCFEETFICGAGSKDPRNDPSHPEYDPASQTHSYGCITDAVAFGAKPEVDGKDKASHQDSDTYSVDDYH